MVPLFCGLDASFKGENKAFCSRTSQMPKKQALSLPSSKKMGGGAFQQLQHIANYSAHL